VIVSCLKIPKLSLSRIPTSLCGRQAGSSATRYRPIFSTSERDIGHVFPRPRRRPGRHRGPTGSHAAQSSRREDWLRQSPWQRQTTLSSRIIDIWATTSVCVCDQHPTTPWISGQCRSNRHGAVSTSFSLDLTVDCGLYAVVIDLDNVVAQPILDDVCTINLVGSFDP